MVLVSTLVSMQPQTRSSRHHRPAAPDESDYVELPKPNPSPSTVSSSSSSLPTSQKQQLQQQQHSNVVNGFQHNGHYHETGPGSYRSSSLTRITNGNSSSSRNGSSNNSSSSNNNNSSTHQQRSHHHHNHVNPRPSSMVIPSHQRLIDTNSNHHHHNHQNHYSTENNNSDAFKQIPPTQRDRGYDVLTLNSNKRNSTTSLNFNHENLFYQPSIHSERVAENDVHAKLVHRDDDHHHNNHHEHRPRSHHHHHHHRHTSPSSHRENGHSLPPRSSSSSATLSREHLSSSHPARASRPTGLNLQHTFPPPSSSSLSSASPSSSSSQSQFRSATLPRPSHAPPLSTQPSSSSSLSSPTSSTSHSHNNSGHYNSTTMTRSSAQQENGHPADSSVIARRGDTRTHVQNITPTTLAVNQKHESPLQITQANHSSTSKCSSNSSSRGNKTYHDTPYHYSPSSLIDVGHTTTTIPSTSDYAANEKNGRDQTIDFAMKSGYFNQNGRVTNTENTTRAGSSATQFQAHTLDRSGSTKSNKSQVAPKNSLEDFPASSRLSAVLDIPMSSITNADSWSPSYIKMDFFMGNGDSSSSSTNPSPVSSSGFPVTSSSSKHTILKSALRNGYKSHILSNSFDSSASTQSSSRILENESNNRSHDSSQENISRSDNSSASSKHEYQQQHEEMTTHHARLLTVSRSTMDLRNSSSSNGMGVSPVLDSVCGTLPQKVRSQFLRRSVSHDPREVETTPKPPVIRTSSDGEIESEYVTLDHSYIPLNNSGLCRVSEIVVDDSSKPVHTHTPLIVLPTASNKHTNPKDIDYVVKTVTVTSEKNTNIKRIHNPVFTNDDSNIKSDSSSNSMTQTLPPTNLVNTKRSMRHNLLKMNSFPDSLRRQAKGKNNSGNLCTVVENDVSAVSSSTSSSTMNLMHESFFTLPRNRSSFVADTRSSPSSSSFHSAVDNHRISTGHDSDSDNTNHRNNPKSKNPLHATTADTAAIPMPKSILIRSKSLPDLQQAINTDGQQQQDDQRISNNNNYSDDEDGDEFGFLSYPISFSPSSPLSSSTVMQKAKSPSPSSRILPKRWRSTKAKAVPGVTCAAMWTPGPLGSCMWSSVSGRKVVLRPTSILSLSEAERIALQKVAFSKLQEMALNCPIVIPKDATDVRRSKKSALSLKRRSKSVSLSPNAGGGKESTGLVFGIPITKCIKNDRETEKKRWKMASAATTSSASAAASPAAKIRTEWADSSTTPRSTRKSSSSSQGSLDKSCSTQNGTMGVQRQDTLTVPSYKRAASSDSLSESESSRNTSSSLIDALSLSASCPASRLSSAITDRITSANQGELQVPNLVNTCFKHIQTHGLQTLGIFRVGCSKKRVKELREEFDSGKDVDLREEYHPHDVGALLKEYFRDLPEPLLTRELYLPFLHAKRLTNEHKRSAAIQLLISMLPVANRDTLWALLLFLATVSQHAGDSVDDKGEKVSGNKMDSHNLATLFGPNILHRTKSMDKDHSLESAESVEESKEVIQVVKEMIECNHELYEISGSLRDDVLRLIVDSDQETADRILKQLANQNQIEADPESMCSVFEDSTGSPVLSHAMNSDADFFAYAKRQTSASQRPLRVTKSVEDNLDSPLSKTRATHFSDSYANSSTHDLKIPPSNTHPCIHQDMVTGYPSPTPNRIPILQLPHESSPDNTAPEVVLRSRMELSSGERPYSESFSQNLSIPRPIYLRESSNSSVSSCLSSSLNSHRDSDGNNHSGYWALPTPPASRGASPKPIIRSASSSSTLIPSPSPVKLGHSHPTEDYNDNNQTKGSPEWERERWRHWEMMASEKRNSEVEQETLV